MFEITLGSTVRVKDRVIRKQKEMLKITACSLRNIFKSQLRKMAFINHVNSE